MFFKSLLVVLLSILILIRNIIQLSSSVHLGRRGRQKEGEGTDKAVKIVALYGLRQVT